MSWQDPLDFSSSYPFTSGSLHMSPGSYPAQSSPGPFDSAYSVERDFCSDFICCGLHLSDLHSLLEHFEEIHVLVIDNAGNPVLPRTRSSDDFDDFHLPSFDAAPPSDDPAYPYTSLVCSYPQFDPQPPGQHQAQPYPQSEPVSPLEVEESSVAHFPQPLFLDHEQIVQDQDILADVDAASASESENNLNSPTSEKPEALPPSSFETDPHDYRRGSLPPYEHRRREAYKSRILGTKPGPYQRKREKAHRCPTPGCSKSYLNPNGLKYHVEKGTCKIEPVYPLSD